MNGYCNEINQSCTIPEQHPLSRKLLLERYRVYGFIECAKIIMFLEFVCDTNLGISELHYIMEKTKECVLNHDDGSDYFNDLKNIIYEINV
jgi:hypothetical protein